MFILKWRGDPPPDESDWFAIVGEVFRGTSGSYQVCFYPGSHGWRFELDCREDLGQQDPDTIANSSDSVRFSLYQALAESGKSVDPESAK